MAFQKVVVKPGVNVEFTPTLNEAGWSFSNLIRFKAGLAQKLGGWQRISQLMFTGTVRGMHAWNDLTGLSYLAGGSEQRLQVFQNQTGQLIDITPIRQTDNVAVNFSTDGVTSTVTVVDAGNGASATDWVDVVVPVSVGGLVLQGLYQIQTIVSSSTYTITAAKPSTALVNNGGAVPLFTTLNTQTYVRVTLANHGYPLGSTTAGLFSVQISTTVAGITMFGTYTAVTTGLGGLSDANNFYIVPGAAATSGTTGSENGGNAQFQYLISTGLVSVTLEGGYGFGTYGSGPYGVGTGAVPVALRSWYLDNFGQNLVGNFNGSTLYQWAPPATVFAGTTNSTNPATPVSNAPITLNSSFVSNPQQMVVALGVQNAGTGGQIDPNLVAWCDAGVITTWTAAANNQAGTFRIPTGSRIVGGLVTPQQNIIWTDLDAWAMQYIGLPFVWGFQKIANECGLISGHAAGVLVQRIFWMGSSNFFTLGPGGATVLPCTVWDTVFNNLNATQAAKIFCAVNTYFQEISWYYPSATGTGEIDSYVKFNVQENAWDYGSLVRTAWQDQNVLGAPIGIDGTGLMQQHEVSPDADGSPMGESIQTGYFDVAGGEAYVFVERMIPDFSYSGTPASVTPGLMLTVYLLEYPGDANSGVGPIAYGPYTITSATQMVVIRGRCRQAALKIQGMGLGTVWRVGAIRHNGQPDGRR